MDDNYSEALNLPSGSYSTRLSVKFRNRTAYKPANIMDIVSFIPGTIMDILVVPGQIVQKGDTLIILDAMKMQNKIKSHISGKIKSISVEKGNRVSKGTLLIELE